jgi:hypothetical protein
MAPNLSVFFPIFDVDELRYRRPCIVQATKPAKPRFVGFVGLLLVQSISVP